MRISVVTPSYNQSLFLHQAIVSVLTQNFTELEYIIVDGQSTDNSADIIRTYQKHIDLFIHEKDNGQADAINKGFENATGDIFCWLNADDVFLPGAFDAIAVYFQAHPDCQWLAGNCIFSDIFQKPLWQYKVPSTEAADYVRFWDDMYLAQPSVFFRKSLWENAGPLNTDLHYALDHDLWFRFFREAPLHILNKSLSVNRIYPQTKTSTGKEEALKELTNVIIHHAQQLSADYNADFIYKKLRAFFLKNELGIFRGKISTAAKDLFAYSLTPAERIRAISSAFKILVR